MQPVGKTFWATLLSILRQGLLLIPLLFILNALGGLNGVIYGQFSSLTEKRILEALSPYPAGALVSSK